MTIDRPQDGPKKRDFERWADSLPIRPHLAGTLNALITFAWDSPSVWCSQPVLAKKAHKTIRSVRRDLVALEKLGIIVVIQTHRFVPEKHTTNTYVLQYVAPAPAIDRRMTELRELRSADAPISGLSGRGIGRTDESDLVLLPEDVGVRSLRTSTPGDSGHVRPPEVALEAEGKSKTGGTLPPDPLRQPSTATRRPVTGQQPHPSDVAEEGQALHGDHRPRARTPERTAVDERSDDGSAGGVVGATPGTEEEAQRSSQRREWARDTIALVLAGKRGAGDSG